MEPNRKILIVEDNPGDVRLMREALRDLRPAITLLIAQDADEAWSALANAEEDSLPHLVFLDFNLPKGGSRGFLERLKSDDRLRLVPVAVLTTSDAERDIYDAYQLHANCYLRKPVDLDGFLETIRRAADFWLNVACTVESRTSRALL